MAKPIRVLIIGNGFGGTYALKNLHKLFRNDRLGGQIELSLVGEQNYFLFTPLLHEVATGGINPENIIEPIRNVLGHFLKNFYMGKAELVDLSLRTVKVGNNLISYDYLVLATGAQTNFYGIQGAAMNSFPLKSLDDAIKIKNRAISQMERASHAENEDERKKMLKFVVVGGGPTGVELAAELMELIMENFSRFYSSRLINDASVALIQMGPQLVPQFGEKMRKKSLEVLRKKGINVRLSTKVMEISANEVTLESGEKISSETVIWVAGVMPNVPEFNQAVEKSPNGQLVVNEYLQLEGYSEVFALGDIASFRETKDGPPLPALAQVAEREALSVAKNIRHLIKGEPPQAFSYHHSGDFISLGRWMAIGEVYNFTFWGGIAWWIWRTVYLSKLISFRKKVEVAIDWTISIFSKRDISKI